MTTATVKSAHKPHPAFRKISALGGDPEGSFEQSFASLGYGFIQDNAPKLLDYLVGFQLVDRSDDMQKAIGIFGFQLGQQWIYMPLFFLNGEIRGTEMLFVKSQNKGEGQFVPAKENWINYLLSKRPHMLGEGSPKDVFQLGGQWPDLRSLTNQYRTTKYGQENPKVADWAVRFLPSIAKMATTNPLREAKYANMQNFTHLMQESPYIIQRVLDIFDVMPLAKQAAFKHHGSDFLTKSVAVCRKKAQERKEAEVPSLLAGPATLPMSKPKVTNLLSGTSQEEEEEDPIKSGAVKIMKVDMNEVLTRNVDRPTREEASEVVRGNVRVSDERQPSQKSTLYNVETTGRFNNPVDTQVNEVLTGEGKYEKCLIIAHPYSGAGQHAFVTVVRLAQSKSKNWLNSCSTEVWVHTPASSPQMFHEWFNGIGSADLAVDNTYVAVLADGSGTAPFTVNKSLGEGLYRVDWNTYSRPSSLAHYGRNYDSARHQQKNPNYDPWDALLHLNGRKGSAIKTLQGELYLPETAKIIKIQTPPDYSNDETEDDVSPLKPGNLIDVQAQIMHKTASLKLYASGLDEVIIKAGDKNTRLSKQAAYISLIKDHGLGIEDADTAFAQLAEKRSAAYRILYAPFYAKKAFGLTGYGGDLLDQGPSAPRETPAPTGSGFPINGGAINRFPQEEEMEVPGYNASMTDPYIYDPTRPIDPNATASVLQDALQTGQKEVFDTGMLSSLLNTINQDSVVDRYLPDLMKGLDRIGRILFSFYWHMDAVRDRYGSADTPELMDAMRNAFEAAGDVTLKLRQNSSNGDAMELSEPNVENAAAAE